MAALNGPFGCPKCKKKKKKSSFHCCVRGLEDTTGNTIPWLFPQCFIHHWCQDLSVAVAFPDNASCCCPPEATCLTAAYDVPPERHRVVSGCKPSDPCAEKQSRALGDSKMPSPRAPGLLFQKGCGNGDPVFPFARLSSHWITHWRNSSKTHAQTASP